MAVPFAHLYHLIGPGILGAAVKPAALFGRIQRGAVPEGGVPETSSDGQAALRTGGLLCRRARELGVVEPRQGGRRTAGRVTI